MEGVASGIKGDFPKPGGEIMSTYPEIKNYLKNIEKELAGLDVATKSSIIQEIDEHLGEKLEEIKSGVKSKKVTSKRVKKILEDFGEPKEIASEYRRQLFDDKMPDQGAKKTHNKGVMAGIAAILIIVSLILASIIYIGWFDGENDDDEPSGPWLQAIAWKPGGDYCLIVGEGTPIIKYDGNEMDAIESSPIMKFFDVAWHPSGDFALICGINGAIYKFDGINLIDLSIQMPDGFFAIKFTPNGDYALAVGANGLLGLVKDNQSKYCYIPDYVIKDIFFYDLAWLGNGSSALLVGYRDNSFTNGIMLSFTPGMDRILNATYNILSTPPSLSTCFSTLWIDEWNSIIVTANMAQIYRIGENWTIDLIPNPFSKIDPIIDALWHPLENRVILVGGLAGWNMEENRYELDKSTRHVMSTDGNKMYLIESRQGPHYLSCGWNPVDESVILIGAFGVTNKYQDGKVSELEIDYEKFYR